MDERLACVGATCEHPPVDLTLPIGVEVAVLRALGALPAVGEIGGVLRAALAR